MNKKQQIKKNQTFFTRTKSAIFVVSFYVLYALLLIFSNENWFPILKDLDYDTMRNIQFSLNFLNVITLIPIIYFVSKEITDLCFPGKKAIFIYTVFSIFVFTIGASVYLLGTRYGFFQWTVDERLNYFTVFLLIILCGIVFFTIMSTLIWIFMSKHIVYVGKKTRIWYPVLVFVLNTFFVGFIYTTIIHTWTTFLFLIVLSSCCDVFAYIGGSKFGKHKLAPYVSPNKTWEGLGFGIGTTLLLYCGIIGLFFIPGAEGQGHSLYCFLGSQWETIGQLPTTWMNLQPYYWAIYIPVGILLMVISVFGDLFFSFCKRRFNIKDFSNLIPGHGGILDRIDSLVFVFTFFFLTTTIIQLVFILAIPGTQTGLEYLWGKQPNFVF